MFVQVLAIKSQAPQEGIGTSTDIVGDSHSHNDRRPVGANGGHDGKGRGGKERGKLSARDNWAILTFFRYQVSLLLTRLGISYET